jgi:hypothetical protein
MYGLWPADEDVVFPAIMLPPAVALFMHKLALCICWAGNEATLSDTNIIAIKTAAPIKTFNFGSLSHDEIHV